MMQAQMNVNESVKQNILFFTITFNKLLQALSCAAEFTYCDFQIFTSILAFYQFKCEEKQQLVTQESFYSHKESQPMFVEEHKTLLGGFIRRLVLNRGEKFETVNYPQIGEL